MKRKLKSKEKKVKQIQSECYSEPPPWIKAKSKMEAFQRGQKDGELAMRRHFDSEQKQKQAQELASERAVKLRALQDICQAGSTIIEGMSKALLSLNNHL